MERILKITIMEELQIIKHLLKDSELEGTISSSTRNQLMGYIGSMKNVLYNDLEFKSLYAKAKQRI